VQYLDVSEKKSTMGMMSSWERKGLMQGKEELVVRLIRRRFGSVSDSTTAHLDKLSAEQLDELGEALFDFSSPSDLEQWLTRH
jgi:hypothetical protein